MLPAAMSPERDLSRIRRPIAALLCLLALVAVPLALGACGEEEEVEVVEGEPLELGELGYNVLITRFLNPADVEDASYLVGQPEPEAGTDYLGVFLTIKNHSDEALASASEYVIHDTLDNAYEPIPSTSLYALDIGGDVPARGVIPLPDSTPAAGLNQAAMLLFLVDEEVSQNRPLKMEIGSDAGAGEVELDI
jgi:hypothetical protein